MGTSFSLRRVFLSKAMSACAQKLNQSPMGKKVHVCPVRKVPADLLQLGFRLSFSYQPRQRFVTALACTSCPESLPHPPSPTKAQVLLGCALPLYWILLLWDPGSHQTFPAPWNLCGLGESKRSNKTGKFLPSPTAPAERTENPAPLPVFHRWVRCGTAKLPVTPCPTLQCEP